MNKITYLCNFAALGKVNQSVFDEIGISLVNQRQIAQVRHDVAVEMK